MTRARLWSFAILAALCITLAVSYGIHAKRRGNAARNLAPGASLPPPPPELRQRTHVIFLSSDPASWGRVLLADASTPTAPRYAAGMACDRVYFAGGRGLCLTSHASGVQRYRLDMFDASFRTTGSVELPGYPSRARVSPDGRYGAFTVFVSGHSYAVTGFSTRTEILDLAAGRSLGDLETFAITREGSRLTSPDVNFWGVTFVRNSPRFYATLATSGRTYLVEGDLESRTVVTLRENAECPSLSPDGTRIVFKRRISSFANVRWQLTVLDLRTGQETPLAAEPSSVDDQAEWLDAEQVLYGIPDRSGRAADAPDLWAVRADGTGAPRLFLADAASPAVVRSAPEAAAATRPGAGEEAPRAGRRAP
jgi:Tol biopolymer transport system component